MANSIAKQIVYYGEKRQIDDLKKFVKETSLSTLTTIMENLLGTGSLRILWNSLLLGFDLDDPKDRQKRLACVKFVLAGFTKVEFTDKQTYDIITRLSLDLATFSCNDLVFFLEYSIDGMRSGDPKCVSWKYLLPETLNILSAMAHFKMNGVMMTGSELRVSTIRNLCTMRWALDALIPMADMFKDLKLNTSEMSTFLTKFSDALQGMTPSALPALAYQLFSMCTTAAQIMIPILGMERFFTRYYYKNLYADMSSNSTNYDSIQEYSEKELREAEETILHHLNYCVQYKINETQMCNVLRNFLSMPDVILTPFVLSCLLSMTKANRDPESILSSSTMLPFLRNIIKNNEEERMLADYSLWCRDTLQVKHVNLEQVFSVLIDQNKQGRDLVTPGLVNLAFVLLKAKNNDTLNNIAIRFLIQFIHKRFVFGQGVVKKVADWMIVDQDHRQYAECLTALSVSDTYTVSECTKTINDVLDTFMWISGEVAMRMMSFILPILKLSSGVRDALIKALHKTMKSSDEKIRCVAVYGFCMILKQLNNSNSQRFQPSNVSGICTQHSISGFPLMSQATLGNRSNPQRHFDMLTLEIIGLLRNCFSQTLEMKCTLYENLQRAIEINPRLIPHVLQFIDWHFRSYFEVATTDRPLEEDKNQFEIKFDKIVFASDLDDCEIEVRDNLGKLIQFISHCLAIFKKSEAEYEIREMQKILNLSVEKITLRDLKFDEMNGSITYLKKELVAQQLNFLEGLMSFLILMSEETNDEIRHLLSLFKAHQKCSQAFKSLPGSSKKPQKKSKLDGSILRNVTINGKPMKKMSTSMKNIWDIVVIERLIRLLHGDGVVFAKSRNIETLRSNREFVRYVLEMTIIKIESIRLEPSYKQVSHSQRLLKFLTEITKVIYEQCIKRLPALWTDFDITTAALAAECFQQCIQTANDVYKKKFQDVFLKGFDCHVISKSKESVSIIHDIIDEFMTDPSNVESSTCESLLKNPVARRIPIALFNSLELLYDNISYNNRLCTESFTWLLKFCETYDIQTKELSIVHKLLFMQRQKTHLGAFFNVIACHLGHVFGFQDEERIQEEIKGFELKSITQCTSESCLNYLYNTLRKQIEDVEYFIGKANNLSNKYRIIPEDEKEMCLTSLQQILRSVCSQLMHVSHTLLSLTNICIPLGPCMDGLLKLLMQHYICLKNLARHYLGYFSGIKVPFHSRKFEILLQVVGKPLPSHIYTLITYIEANIFDDQNKKKITPQAAKAKVLRDTKFIPKIIHGVENFNKFVILLSKKDNDHLSNLLHIGVVRDFRIRTPELKAAIDRTFSHASQIRVDDSMDCETQMTEEDENLANNSNADKVTEPNDDVNNVQTDENDENVEQLNVQLKKSKQKVVGKTGREPMVSALANAEEIRNENKVKKINPKAKKRSLKEVEKPENGEKPEVQSAPKRPRRERAAKK